MQSILRIDLGAAGAPAAWRVPSGRYAGLAGRAMTSLVASEEVAPDCHPLGGGNVLVLAPDRRPGSGVAEAVAVGCKSPLTGGILASRAVAPAAEALQRLGYAAVVIRGQPAGDDLWTILVGEGGVTFAVENRYRMLGNLETVAKLRTVHGAGAALLTIGPAGETALGAASVTCPAGGARPTRHCGLGGAGAVMGSKRLKAIVVAWPGGAEPPDREASSPERAAGDLSPYRAACGVRDPVVLGQLESLEDDLGLDAAEIAAAISIAMEAGLARFGDGQAMLRLVEEIARGSPLGRILGSGQRVVAEAFGLDDGAPAGAPAVRPHPIVFGQVDDDVARLLGVLDPDADPFDPQLQLPIGLRPPQPVRARVPLPVRPFPRH